MESPYFEVQELSDGVYAAIAKPGEGAMSNAGIIDLGEELLIVDTFTTPGAARALRQVAEELTKKSVNYVFNTHYHGDHTFGNQVFSDSVIISTSVTRALHIERNKIGDRVTEKKEMAQYLKQLEERLLTERDPIAKQSVTNQLKEMIKVFESIDELQIIPPSLLFEEKLVIAGERRTVEMHCHGGGHTPSDAYVYLPEEKMVFAGDLILEKLHPPIYDSAVFIENLQNLSLFEIEKIVTGDGGIVGRGQIETMIAYIKHLHQTIQTASKTGDDIKQLPPPTEYRDWLGVDGYKRNLMTVQRELKSK